MGHMLLTCIDNVFGLEMQISADPSPEVGHGDSLLSLFLTIFLSKKRSKITGVSVASF